MVRAPPAVVLVTRRAAVEARSERREMLGCKQVSIIVGFRVHAVAPCNEVRIQVRRSAMIPGNTGILPLRTALTSLRTLTVVNLPNRHAMPCRLEKPVCENIYANHGVRRLK